MAIYKRTGDRAPDSISDVRIRKIDISQVYYGLRLVWQYITTGLLSKDDKILMSRDGFILDDKR